MSRFTLEDFLFIKESLGEAGFRLPGLEEIVIAETPRKYDRRLPGVHTLVRWIAKQHWRDDIDTIVTVEGKSRLPAELLAHELERLSGRPVRVIRVEFKRMPPRPGSIRHRGRLRIAIRGDHSNIANSRILLFEDVIRATSFLPHLGKEVQIAGGTIVGIASFVTYRGIWERFRTWMGRFAERPFAYHRVELAGQLSFGRVRPPRSWARKSQALFAAAKAA